MRKVIQFRWLIFVLWIAAAVSLLLFSPNLQELVREKGQITIPESYSSVIAGNLIDEMSSETAEDSISGVIVFRDNHGISDDGKAEIQAAIKLLKEKEIELGISNILDFSEDERIAEQVISEDNTTILVPMNVSFQDQEIEESREKIYDAISHVKVEHLLTGEEYIQQDIIINSEEGLKKTEYITVGFILLILFLVFRSLVAPFIPLITVGISYLAAQGIVSILADTVNFPLSTFTQIFMVAVMFGIGTDYCILLISRFKEELANHDSTKEAVIATYKSGGKTIFFAGLAVLIGFSTIGLSTFSLYQSAVAVAVGVAVVLLALPTLVPFFLVLLGKKMFWPFDKNVAHKQSKLWGAVGNFAWTRPIVALLIVVAITIPVLLTYDGVKSYNSLEEIGDDYGSVKGFNWIADSFGPGETMPATVVLQTDEKIDDAVEFQDIETISHRLAQIEGVKAVRSATRPTGEILENFKITNQTDQLGEGIGQSVSGIDQIQTGLDEAAEQISNNQPQLEEAEEGIEQLLGGTLEANNGVGEMITALTQIRDGIVSGSQGAEEMKENLVLIRDGVQDVIDFNQMLVTNLGEVEQGLKPLVQAYQGYFGAISGAYNILANNVQEHPEPEKNEQLQTAIATLRSVVNGTDDSPSMEYINTQLTTMSEGLTTAIQQINEQTKDSNPEQLIEGLNALIGGLEELQIGLGQAASGQNQVINGVPALQSGLTQIYGGQEELQNAFVMMQDQMTQLSDGLTQSADGLDQVSEGLSQVENYLGEFSAEGSTPMVSIPKEALENEQFMEGIKPYLSEDKTITKFEVILENSPYSTEAKNLIEKISQTAEDARVNTSFENASQSIGGISSTNNDLQNMSDEDYSRTVVLMLAGIFIILVILLKSLIMPIYLIGSLVLTYFTSMGIAELIFVNGLGFEGISWAVPFFAFVILMALGIDYSIFLMDRFNEYKDMNVREALMTSMKNMGTVIISAAVILGGTFAAMLPSGVLSLLQIATIVLAGLFLYAMVMLPLFIPVMVKLLGKANWWPFNRS
ncbi:RND superfamily putative drug exporter [Salirhabdus euzebyi]|uniref:RND superfamily putative drug exporter n=1 Tax=Salirhabdus euzebyi TaxID=394506 RepID=A0A841Q9U6_9BACI|nr:MMPL family transporter [Salirhabdus euzebyi]MBB6455073.1 RND superfamily putative drug exporter [Salirhabdus euzebyi]